jgi:hypothetical protein
MIRTEKRFGMNDFLGSSFRNRELIPQDGPGLQGGQPGAMHLADFAIERFGGAGLGIERGDGMAEPGLFSFGRRQMLDFGVDGRFVRADFVIEQGGIGGLGPDEPPFVGDEGIGVFLLGDSFGLEPGEPALAEQGELFGIFVAEEETRSFGFGAGVAAVLEAGLAGTGLASGGDRSLGLGAVDARLCGARILLGLQFVGFHGRTLTRDCGGRGSGNRRGRG